MKNAKGTAARIFGSIAKADVNIRMIDQGSSELNIIVGINNDGSIVVREMNYGYRAYVVTESTIPANIVGNFNYIH